MTGSCSGLHIVYNHNPLLDGADVDLAITDDFYKYFKSDLLAGMNWVCGCESDCGRMACNGGDAPTVNSLDPCWSACVEIPKCSTLGGSLRE